MVIVVQVILSIVLGAGISGVAEAFGIEIAEKAALHAKWINIHVVQFSMFFLISGVGYYIMVRLQKAAGYDIPPVVSLGTWLGAVLVGTFIRTKAWEKTTPIDWALYILLGIIVLILNLRAAH